MQLPNQNSSSQDWIDWHKWLKRNVGSSANEIFMANWQKVGQGSSANDAMLRAYAKTQGMDIKGEYFLLSAASDVWQSTNTGAKRIGSMTMIGVLLITVMLLGAVYFLFLKPQEQ